MSQAGTKDLTREELYEKVWSAATTKVAAELGISDVALAKRCKKLNVPKPSIGYWAKVAAGQKPKMPPLPPTASEVFIQAAAKPLAKSLSIPETTEQLHPLATDLKRALNAGKPDSQKRINVRERTLPEVTITKGLIERAVKALHVILDNVESLGIPFRKAQGSYGCGYFQKSHDRLYLKIEEELVEPGTSTPRPSWQWSGRGLVASGVLSFSLGTESYTVRDAKNWRESDKLTLGELLAQIVAEIRRHYVAAQKRREQEAIDREKQRIESELHRQEYQRKEAIRLEEERKAKHAAALAAMVQGRNNDLVKAAEWWRFHQVVMEFIDECERRWRNGQAGELVPEQVAWLNWARENSQAMSPFELGYPDPAKDGAFDPASIPFGGPYPAKRDFPQPPTMPEIPPPVILQSGYGPAQMAEPKQYPFWLKHPR